MFFFFFTAKIFLFPLLHKQFYKSILFLLWLRYNVVNGIRKLVWLDLTHGLCLYISSKVANFAKDCSNKIVMHSNNIFPNWWSKQGPSISKCFSILLCWLIYTWLWKFINSLWTKLPGSFKKQRQNHWKIEYLVNIDYILR